MEILKNELPNTRKQRVKLVDNFTIFDDVSKERSNNKPAKYGDTDPYNYLNESSRSLCYFARRIITEWFDIYRKIGVVDDRREDKCKNLLKSFKGKTTGHSQHAAAFFELYQVALFHKIGLDIEIDPIVPEGTPDFLIINKSTNEKFYVEATTITLKSSQRLPKEILFSKNVAASLIINKLNNKIQSERYKINVELQGECSEHDLKNDLYLEINKWLKYPIEAFERAFNVDNRKWGMRLTAYPAIPHSSSSIVISFMSSSSLYMKSKSGEEIIPGANTFEPLDILKSIEKKIEKYKKLNAPYIIAINFLDDSNVTTDHKKVIDMAFDKVNGIFKHNHVTGIIAFFNLLPLNIIPQEGSILSEISSRNITARYPIIAFNPEADHKLCLQEIPILNEICPQAFIIDSPKLSSILEISENEWWSKFKS